MKILEKINFRQTKYMLPAILYLPLLGGTYFIFDLFHTETAEIPDKALQTTEFLNPELPEAQIKDDGIGSKYENMAKAWGKIQDYSAVDNIDRDDPADNKEEYESQYTQDDIALLDEQQQEKALAAQAADAKRREQEALAELEKALAEARLKGQSAATPPAEADTAAMAPPPEAAVEGTIDEESRSVRAPAEGNRASEVVKKVKTASDYFNTLAKDAREPKLIQAIIDEDVKAVDGFACQAAPARRHRDRRMPGRARHLPVRHRERLFVWARERKHRQHTRRRRAGKGQPVALRHGRDGGTVRA